LVVVEDDGAVLRAYVAALTVRGRRGVGREEDEEEVAGRHLLGVVGDLDDLGVAGAAGADLAVGGVLDAAAGVAGRDLPDAAERLHHGLDAPEAAAAEGRGFGVGTHSSV